MGKRANRRQKKRRRRDGHLVERIAYGRYLLISYIFMLGTAMTFIGLFALTFWRAFCVILCAVIMAPMTASAWCRNLSEHKRFEDINAYMQQFMNGMLLHSRIMAALEDTAVSFPKGSMHDELRYVIYQMQRCGDIREAQARALHDLEQKYPNSQIGLIHDFSIRIEQHGGEFEQEMAMLKDKRARWEKRTEHCQNQMRLTVISSLVLFFCMILVCGVVQRLIPEQLAITYVELVQRSEIILIILFYWFIYWILMDMSRGWLCKEKFMDEKEATKLLSFLEEKQKTKRRFKGILYYIRFIKVRREITYAVPKWLFDVCLLMQKFNITVSITESLKTAPPIIKKDIRLLLERLRRNPSSYEPYLRFLEGYGIRNVRSTMRMLVSIQNGASGDSNMQMQQLVVHNMDMLDQMDDRRARIRDARSIRFEVYPMIPCGIVMGGYLFSIVVKIFQMMSSMI